MKGIITLLNDGSGVIEEYSFNCFNYDFQLVINLYENKTLEEKLANKERFLKILEENEYLYDNKNEKKAFNFLKKHFDNILKSVEFINIAFECDDYLKYINDNPILLSKKIVLPYYLNLNDLSVAMKIYNEFYDIKDKIYVNLSFNSGFVSIEDCIKTMNLIKEQADEIKKYNLSPMENIMVAYDLIRNREYKLEDKNDDSFKSRDLSQILFDDKIVCSGFSNYFSAFLENFGLNMQSCKLIGVGSKKGHERNVAYIKDDKYDVNGVYYFDVTWDCKEENSDQYLYEYQFFACRKNKMDSINNRRGIFDEKFPVYFNTFDEFKDYCTNGEKTFDVIRSVNYMSKLVNDKYLIKNEQFIELLSGGNPLNRVKNDLKELIPLFDKPMKYSSFVRLLCNVKRVENEINPELYQFDLKTIYYICHVNKWIRPLTDEERLLSSIFGVEPDEFEVFIDDNKEILEEFNLLKDKEKIKRK